MASGKSLTILLFALLYFSSCATFSGRLPYVDSQNHLRELRKEKQIFEELKYKLPPSDVDIVLRLNKSLQNAIIGGRDKKYVLFLYKIYSQKMSQLLDDTINITGVQKRKVISQEEKPPVNRGYVMSPKDKSIDKVEQEKNSEKESLSSSNINSEGEITENDNEENTESENTAKGLDCDFEQGIKAFDSLYWPDAYAIFQKCMENGIKIDESQKYLSDIEKRVIVPDWNKANLLAYQARSESDAQRKKEFLQQAQSILEEILKKYPNNKYEIKIQKNIGVIKKMLSALTDTDN